MGDSDWSAQLARLGYESQLKFNFYLVALTFTILGLAIQTASFGANLASDFFELIGWLSLLLAGIAGLQYLEWQPQIFQLQGLKSSQETRLTSLRKAKAQGSGTAHFLDSGQEVAIHEVIKKDEADLGSIEGRIKDVERRSGVGFRIRTVTLPLGLGLLMLSRGLEPATRLVDALR
jgi:hypothetical protein